MCRAGHDGQHVELRAGAGERACCRGYPAIRRHMKHGDGCSKPVHIKAPARGVGKLTPLRFSVSESAQIPLMTIERCEALPSTWKI